MKSVLIAVLAVATLNASMATATTTFVCQFLKTSHLKPVKISLGAEQATLQLKSSDGADHIGVAEGGESAVLYRRSQRSQEWMGYDGSTCTDEDQNRCQGLQRGFSLNFPVAGLTSPEAFSAELQMTQLSGYIPGAPYYSYSLQCVKAKK